MSHDEFTLMSEMAAKAARVYSNKCWWADRVEMRQEAWLALLSAARTYDPSKGTAAGYYWCVAAYTLSAYLYRQTAPVSESFHKLLSLSTAVRVELDEAQHYPSRDVPADEALDEARWQAGITKRLDQLFREIPDGHLA